MPLEPPIAPIKLLRRFNKGSIAPTILRITGSADLNALANSSAKSCITGKTSKVKKEKKSLSSGNISMNSSLKAVTTPNTPATNLPIDVPNISNASLFLLISLSYSLKRPPMKSPISRKIFFQNFQAALPDSENLSIPAPRLPNHSLVPAVKFLHQSAIFPYTSINFGRSLTISLTHQLVNRSTPLTNFGTKVSKPNF